MQQDYFFKSPFTHHCLCGLPLHGHGLGERETWFRMSQMGDRHKMLKLYERWKENHDLQDNGSETRDPSNRKVTFPQILSALQKRYHVFCYARYNDELYIL